MGISHFHGNGIYESFFFWAQNIEWFLLNWRNDIRVSRIVTAMRMKTMQIAESNRLKHYPHVFPSNGRIAIQTNV